MLVAVVIVVSEVPRLAAGDGLVAAPAVDGAGCYSWRPLGAELVVLVVVAALLAGAAGLFVVALMSGAVALAWVEQRRAARFGADAEGSGHQRRLS